MTVEQGASESVIQALIERWAQAVQARDLEGVLADHADEIQMFDVPPPNELRGLDAYRNSWPPFFEWLKQGVCSRSTRSTSPPGPTSLSLPPYSAAARTRG
jgi:ketosteroid isomerase-like protein